MNHPKILIIIPAYNEESNIAKTLKEIFALPQSLNVVVINDGSTDSTAQEAKAAGANVVSLPFNLGIGAAVQTGFQFAFERGFDIAVQIDGDGQHDPAYLNTILKPVIDDQADMTIGSRFMPSAEKGDQSSFARRIGINFFVSLIGMLTGKHVYDPTSGFRAYNKRMIKLFSKHYPSDFPEPEAIVVAQRFKARILELPVVMRKRQGGESSIKYFKSLYYMMKVTVAIVLDMLRARRLAQQYGD